jgi:hypothetical protein
MRVNWVRPAARDALLGPARARLGAEVRVEGVVRLEEHELGVVALRVAQSERAP